MDTHFPPFPTRGRPLTTAFASRPRLPRRSIVRAGAALALGRLAAPAGAVAGLAAGGTGRAQEAARTGASEAAAADWEVPGGRFYTQGAPGGAADAGFVVSDADGVLLWRDYRALGGPAELGYPVSARWEADGHTYQATQAAVLEWVPSAGAARVFPLYRALADLELDGWLEARGVPPTDPALARDPDLPVHVRHAWLTHPTLREAYWAAFEVVGPRRFGMPMGAPQRFGPYVAQRFENAVLQLWLDDVPGIRAGTVTAVQVAEVLRDAGLLPDGVLEPQAPPAPRPAPRQPEPAVPQPARAAVASGKYVVVSVGRQWWFGYEDGELLNGGPVTTGRPELYTPQGRFTVLSKHSPYTFISPWPPGSPFWYETATSRYALRITGNGVFLHDAPWRPYYGPGTNVPHIDPDGVWRTGSHGCINMPLQAAAWLYGWAPVGTPVDVTA